MSSLLGLSLCMKQLSSIILAVRTHVPTTSFRYCHSWGPQGEVGISPRRTFVHSPGIWRSLSHARSSIAKLVESKVNLYEALGVTKECSYSRIKKAYYKVAKECHPDTGSEGEETTEQHERFVLANTAYEILSSPESRSTYDKLRGIYTQTSRPAFDSNARTRNKYTREEYFRMYEDLMKRFEDAVRKRMMARYGGKQEWCERSSNFDLPCYKICLACMDTQLTLPPPDIKLGEKSRP